MIKVFKHTVNQLNKDTFESTCKKVAKDLGLEIEMKYDGLEWWLISNGYRFLITLKGDKKDINNFLKVCI